MASLTAIDDVYVAVGCPGGPGHPSALSLQLVEDAADDIVAAVKAGVFNSDLKPRLLVMCQCGLVEIIGVLARKVAEGKP